MLSTCVMVDSKLKINESSISCVQLVIKPSGATMERSIRHVTYPNLSYPYVTILNPDAIFFSRRSYGRQEISGI